MQNKRYIFFTESHIGEKYQEAELEEFKYMSVDDWLQRRMELGMGNKMESMNKYEIYVSHTQKNYAIAWSTECDRIIFSVCKIKGKRRVQYITDEVIVSLVKNTVQVM